MKKAEVNIKKRVAFGRMAKTSKFKAWHKIEVSKRMGTFVDINVVVDEMMKQVRIETKQDGEWKDGSKIH